MYRLKKTLSVLLVFLITLGFIPLLPEASAAYYNDVGSHWASAEINRWNGRGALADFSAGRFHPDSKITRAEFFSLLSRALGATVPGDVSHFTDLDTNSWYYNIVAIAYNMGIANGYDDGTMHPNDFLLRQDAATLVARALGMSTENTWTVSRFPDASSVSSYAFTYVGALVEQGLLSGYPDGLLHPLDYLTRAQAVKIIDNLFPNVYKPESPINNVSLSGGLLITSDSAELRNMVLYGDVIIGDGVGTGSVLLSDCTIEGRVIVRGGGPNSVTLSNSSVRDGIYVASFGADTRIAITGDSIVPEIEAVSGFTLSGSGVKQLTILDQAREGSIVNLSGVNLDELHIGGRGATVGLVSGRAVNVRVDGAGQNALFDLATGTSVENLTIAAPNVTISGGGTIGSLLAKNTGSTITQKPELVTVGANLSAVIAGANVFGPQASTPNMINRADNSALKVQLLPNTSSGAPFDQSSLTSTVSEGRSAVDINISQTATGRIPLTSRNGRYAYWIGFFVPAPSGANNSVTITYTYADGDAITFTRSVTTYNQRRGLLIYLPVFREQGKEVGQLKEMLYINWDGSTTENLQFMSNSLTLASLTNYQKTMLQDNFDTGYLLSINGSSSYTGAEGVRRILSSDNPLGLPSRDNKGLDALNRAVMVDEVRDVLEESVFSVNLTVDTSGNSVYSRLSEDGKTVVAGAVLAARKSGYATPSAVKTTFDKAVNDRLASESTLLTSINAAADYSALRKIIENSANAAVLGLQTGADPYKSYPASQRDKMAEVLYKMRPFPSLQSVINAIAAYLAQNPVEPPSAADEVVTSVTASPTSLTFAMGNKRDVILTVKTSTGTMTPENIKELAELSWLNGSVSAYADVSLTGSTLNFLAKAVGKDTLTVTIGGKSVKIAVNVTAPNLATSIKLNVSNIDLIVGGTQKLLPTLTPAAATDTIKWYSSDTSIATVDENGLVTGVARGVAEISAKTDNNHIATCKVMVFASEDDVVVDPAEIVLTPGGSFKVTAHTYGQVKTLQWESLDRDIATVDNTGLIRIPYGAGAPSETTVKVRVTGSTSFAEVNVSVMPNTGMSLWLDRSIMFSGDTQTLHLDISGNAALQNQKFYIQITGGVGGVAAECLNAQPVGPNDVINIRARETGVGVATIRVFTNPTFSGQPIGDPLYVTVSPMSVDGVTFDYKYTAGKLFIEQASSGTIREDQYGYYLTMYLENRTTVTPMKYIPGSQARSALTQPMTWFTYDCDFNREILQDVKTEYFGGKYYILDLDNNRLKDKSGTDIDFDSVFREEEPFTGSYTDGSIVWRKGYFRFGIDSNTKKSIQRDADMKKVASPIITAVNGNIASNSTQMTGLSAVMMTPSRGNLTADEWNEWGSLYYDVAELFKGGQFNQDIARQSGFVLQEKINGEWTVSSTDIYSATEAMVNSGNFRVVDINGEVLYGNVPVIVNGDSNDSVNVFYVRLLPNDLPKSNAVTTDAVTWRTPTGPDDPGYLKQIFFVPGSLDTYNFRKMNTPSSELKYPYLTAQTAEGNTAAPKDIGVDKLGTQNYYVYITTPYPDIQPPANAPLTYLYNYVIEQGSKLGFAPIGIDGSVNPERRQASVTSTTGTPPLTYTLTMNPPKTVDTVILVVSPTARTLSTVDGIIAGAAIVGIPTGELVGATYTSSDQTNFAITGNTFIANVPGTYNVTVSHNSYPGISYVVTFRIIASEVVPIAGSSVQALSLPGVMPAITDAGIDPADAKIESATPSLLTIDADGMAKIIAPGDAKVTVSDPGKKKTAAVDVKIKPADSSAPATTPPVVPKSVSLRSSATVATGKTLTLLPYFNTTNIDPKTLTWTSSNSKVAVVNSNGIVTGVTTGKATIKLTVSGTKLSASCSVTVVKPGGGATAITLGKTSMTIAAGSSSAISVKYTPSTAAGRGVTWRSSDETVARVSPTGMVSGIGKGSATITATCDLTGVEAKCTVTVTVPVKSVTLSSKSLAMKVGSSAVLTCTINPDDATNKSVTWKSSNSKIVTVDTNGNIKAIAAGTAKITVTSADGKKTAACTVKVTK